MKNKEPIFPKNWERKKMFMKNWEDWKTEKVQKNICPQCHRYGGRFSHDKVCQFCGYEVEEKILSDGDIDRLKDYRRDCFAVNIVPSKDTFYKEEKAANLDVTHNGRQWIGMNLLPAEMVAVIAALEKYLVKIKYEGR